MADLKNALPKTWGSPTMSPHCADEIKYGVVDEVVKHFEAAQQKGEKVIGQPIRDLVTVNGVRVTVEDGTWGLVRASSNKPELVVVVESPVSEARMRDDVQGGRCRAAHASGGRRVQSDDLASSVLFTAPQARGADRLRLHILEHVDLDAARQHRAPGLQVGLQSHVARDT